MELVRLVSFNFLAKKYTVEVFTGDFPKAGTDANVYLTMFGEKNESTEFYLEDSETHRNKFERNNVRTFFPCHPSLILNQSHFLILKQMDRFKIETYDLGDLNAIRVRHDNAGVLPGWFLDRIEITDLENKKFIFECKKWFSLNKEDGKIDRIIKEIVSFFFF